MAAEQHFQRGAVGKNFHVTTGKPNYQSEYSKGNEHVDREKRLEWNYKLKMPFKRINNYEAKHGKTPMEIIELKKAMLKLTQKDFDNKQ